MSSLISPATVAEIETAPNFAALSAEYQAEAAIPGLPSPSVKWAYYKAMEANGALFAFKAVEGAQLIGFISVVLPVAMKHDVVVAVGDSLFVAKAYRRTWAGLKLLNAAEAKARSLGANLLLNAPSNGPLAEILPRMGYVETNKVFLKCLQ